MHESTVSCYWCVSCDHKWIVKKPELRTCPRCKGSHVENSTMRCYQCGNCGHNWIPRIKGLVPACPKCKRS